MKNSGNILLGILGAAAAGVVIGMIIAPEKGSALRSDIKNSAGDFTKRLGDMLSKGKKRYDELRSMVEEGSDDVRRTAKHYANEAEGTYNEYADKAQHYAGKVEDTYNDLSHEATKAYKKAKS